MDTFEELEALAERGEKVNPYRDVYMSQTALALGRSLLQEACGRGIRKPDLVGPILDGGVHLEWDRGNVTFCLDVAPSAEIGVFIFATGEDRYREQDGVARTDALDWLYRFLDTEEWHDWDVPV